MMHTEQSVCAARELRIRLSIEAVFRFQCQTWLHTPSFLKDSQQLNENVKSVDLQRLSGTALVFRTTQS